MSDVPAIPAIPVPPGWQGILDEGEQILWQGQPAKGIRFEAPDLRHIVPAIFIICFGLFWMSLAVQANLFMAAFGLFVVSSALWQTLGPIVRPAFIRARSFYTLTDRRAIIATDLPYQGRRLTSYPIDRATPLEYLASDPPSILFGPPTGDKRPRAGFNYIADADQVMAMMRKIQRSQTPDQPAPEDAQP
ncbi:aspartate carbamoyltransferase catalytic subunit [Paracoccus sp. S1E-3]|uniref:aspartate carbamoyltransferase catalytic subunit n=1 Tax=Paracoccus sp. S1E-3 TaxID=2756130 RepID=UPI0015EEDC29|nr:aspartate carbamoyltransferase catalytic subunit [Paracoccus sp. S1E-3]MBA4490548.1 aspartate carbamoyltransferase catalytic subunit [Paracoccus sp. S1E-3]